MRVAHVAPTYFEPDSVIGGGERYVTELAKAMALRTSTRLITFGSKSKKEMLASLEVHIHKPLGFARGLRFNPISFSFLSSLWEADVIHCYQPGTVATDLTIIQSGLLRKPVFLTDLGGGADFSLWHHLPLWRGVKLLLAISDFNRSLFRNLPLPVQVIYGGVDSGRFYPGEERPGRRFLHVGRLLFHKGIHHLIDALPPGIGLDVVGPASDPLYERRLQEQSHGKDVAFYAQLSDKELVLKYQGALATVLPALEDSGFTTVLESFACGTPVVVFSTGSLPEVVEDGVTGFVISRTCPGALREKLAYLAAHPMLCREMGARARKEALAKFTWDAVVQRCLEAYQGRHP